MAFDLGQDSGIARAFPNFAYALYLAGHKYELPGFIQ